MPSRFSNQWLGWGEFGNLKFGRKQKKCAKLVGGGSAVNGATPLNFTEFRDGIWKE